MELRLPFRKGQYGKSVTWMGHDIHVDCSLKTVTVAIKPDFMADVLRDASHYRSVAKPSVSCAPSQEGQP